MAPVSLYGLVLCGGASSRMGTDKGLIAYHGVPQREYMYQLLSTVCERTFLSVSKEQELQIPFGFATISDADVYKGPYNGILSADEAYPGNAWLVVACDLPLLNLQALKELINARNYEMDATTFAVKENPLPEPLCAIWEGPALEASKDFLASGQGSSPRKFLSTANVKIVFPTDENVLLNVNSGDEAAQVQLLLQNKDLPL